MSTVNIQINGKPITVEKGTHILAAAKQAGVKIPSLCAHPDLDAWAACGICVVKVSNARGISPKLVRACATECVEGENYITHDPELNKIRRTIIEMILADHPQSCLTCGRNGSCELQTLAAEFGIREIPFARNVKNMPKDDSTGAIVLDPSKCVQCGRCAQVCQQLQNVWALEFIGRGEKTRIAGAGDIVLNETPCIKCGQCSAHCPVGAIYELDETAKLLEAIRNPELTVIAQIAPAVRVAIGEEFDMEPGEVTTGKIYAALRAIGVDTVFDTNFGADLTIMEEGTEFVRRFTENKDLPLITSCCPAWVEYMEKYACDMIPNFSTAKSPQQMQGAITKTYYAQNAGLDPKKIFSVSIMPCTAKKQEIKRSEDMFSSGCQDNDLVLTTRELARLFKQFGIDFKNIEPQEADSPIGQYTGAATIFGVTGGVMEAALRTAYYLVTKEELSEKAVDFTCVRGMEGIKKATVDVKGTPVRVAVAHGLKNVQTLLQEVRDARENGKELPYHFIEVMACKGGCIAGGGQPYGTEDEIRAKRINGLYTDDKKCEFRKSHQNPDIQNPDIQKIYKDFFGEPSSHKAHKLLHTHYVSRPTYKK